MKLLAGRASRHRTFVRHLTLAAAAILLAPTFAAAGPVSFDDPALQASETLQVQVAGLADGAALPVKYTRDGRNLAPPVTWSAGPPGVKSYVLIVQDPDARGEKAALHWLVYDIPAGVLSLPGSMRNVASPDKPLGVAQGWNDHGSFGYSGPQPPPSNPAHHYHFQVFALSRVLHVHPGAHLEQVVAAMRSRLVARGETVVLYAAPAPPVAARPAASASPGAGPAH